MTTVTDDFNRTDATTLGANWGLDPANAVQIKSNKAAVNTTGGWRHAFHNSDPGSLDQTVQSDGYFNFNGSGWLVGRGTGSAAWQYSANCYLLYVTPGNSDQVRLVKRVSYGESVIAGTGSGSAGISLGSTKGYRLEVDGSVGSANVRAYVDDVLICSVTGETTAGITGQKVGIGGDATTTVGNIAWDNFLADVYSAGPDPIAVTGASATLALNGKLGTVNLAALGLSSNVVQLLLNGKNGTPTPGGLILPSNPAVLSLNGVPGSTNLGSLIVPGSPAGMILNSTAGTANVAVQVTGHAAVLLLEAVAGIPSVVVPPINVTANVATLNLQSMDGVPVIANWPIIVNGQTALLQLVAQPGEPYAVLPPVVVTGNTALINLDGVLGVIDLGALALQGNKAALQLISNSNAIIEGKTELGIFSNGRIRIIPMGGFPGGMGR